MKVAVCSTGDTLDSVLDPRFGRCAYFVVVDTETFDATAVENPGIMSAQGAGIQAAQVISSLGVSAVITGNLGPNAHQALSAAELNVYACQGETVRYAVDFFNAGALQEISAPTVAAHSGTSAATPGKGGGTGRGSGDGRGCSAQQTDRMEVNQMPRMDGTGPTGQGPMSGRGLGFCSTPGVNASQVTSQQPTSWIGRFVQGAVGGFGLVNNGTRRGGGRGAGRGRGQGRGRRGSF
ncbi:MAG: NifB/NifX family molybdenum-iron cluster-binding protein [Armatimonadota bacterium]|nr:hypothetical protein [bacterium]